MRNAIKLLVGCALALTSAITAQAQGEVASATLTPISGNGPFVYALTLVDSGSTAIGSVWYSWTPGHNYLPSVPSAAASQTTGWTTSVQGSAGAASVQFVAGAGDALQPGQSATFDFTSADSPSTLAGSVPIGSPPVETPIGTSTAYTAGLFSDGGDKFVVSSVPEPSSWVLLGTTAAGWLALRRRRAAV
jgi:hypothetical protein